MTETQEQGIPPPHPSGVRPEGKVGEEKDMAHGALYRSPEGRLVYEKDGTTHGDVMALRMFPFTDPGHWIALCDREYRELLCIEDIATLPRDMAQLIREDLQAREFVPIIKRVQSVSVAVDPSDWHVETDRGETRFTLTDEDDIHRLGSSRVLIIDDYGIRYLIPDVRKMDASSRRILSHYI